MSDEEKQSERHPRNFQAILDWCERFRPDIRAVVLAEKNNDSFILLMTVGFEAGRQFQNDYPSFPMDAAHLYLAENSPNTKAPPQVMLKWLPLGEKLKTGRYLVGHCGHSEIDWYFNPEDNFQPGTKTGWQNGDPAARFNATHCALLPDCPDKEAV